MFSVFIAAVLAVFVVAGMLTFVPVGAIGGWGKPVTPRLVADRAPGSAASVSLESSVRAPGLHEPTLSAFTVDLAPGRTAILHGAPSTAGYVLVHVLSGTIHAQAWRAGLGDYHAGQTWVQPAIAYDIAAVNASETEPARAFVVVVVP
jgi:quercetin dioxygenase-like cupin family protein